MDIEVLFKQHKIDNDDFKEELLALDNEMGIVIIPEILNYKEQRERSSITRKFFSGLHDIYITLLKKVSSPINLILFSKKTKGSLSNYAMQIAYQHISRNKERRKMLNKSIYDYLTSSLYNDIDKNREAKDAKSRS